jgi:spore germination cell wall hydrolase CwlJ-like protein|tara:strand:+ start:171 stop:752 length:582 start_codon:yes stop_codon:yes gene_type:complete
LTTLTLERDWFNPVAATAGLLKTVGFVVVIAALVTVCTSKLNHLAANQDSWRQGFVSAEDRTRQLECLANNIYWEAASEPFEGKVAVAQVTMNRVESGRFADSVCGVVYQKNVIYEKVVCQFSWYCEGAHRVKPVHPPLWKESQEVAKKVLLEGFRLPSLKDALYFHATHVNPSWGKPMLQKIGQHIFYGEKR